MTGKPGNATFKGKPKLTPRAVRPKTSANPQDSLARIDYDWPGIDFGNGVKGYSHLTIREDGSYTFTGHFHNDSLISYNEVLSFMVKDDQNRVYGFTTQGHTQRFGEGSRDYDWNNSGTNKDIAANWASIWASTAYSGKPTVALISVVSWTTSLRPSRAPSAWSLRYSPSWGRSFLCCPNPSRGFRAADQERVSHRISRRTRSQLDCH
jgi:hypothetical protein